MAISKIITGDNGSRLLTFEEVRAILQIKPSTLYAWCAKGEIPHLRVGRLLRFSHADLERWLKQRRIGCRSRGFDGDGLQTG